MQAEIRKINAETQELKDTIRLERERLKREEMERIKAE